MTAPLRHLFCLTLGLSGLFCVPTILAQPAIPALMATNAAVKTPPMPSLKSPVDMFRDLLAMKAEDRDRELVGRPPQIRERILAKLKEYEAMKPEDRELLLRVTQLRWYLLRFMQLPADNARAALLTELPLPDQQSISNRLQLWDRLPAGERKDVLQYEQTMEQLEGRSLDATAATNQVTARVPTPARDAALKNLDGFLQLPAEQRQQMCASFQKFFDLTDEERQKTIAVLPADQRAQLASAIQIFRRLPQAEREEFLKSLRKFSTMSDSERQEFLKNARRWEEVPSAQQDAWRTLIHGLPPVPQLPQGVVYPPVPRMPALQVSLPVSTNSSP